MKQQWGTESKHIFNFIKIIVINNLSIHKTHYNGTIIMCCKFLFYRNAWQY